MLLSLLLIRWWWWKLFILYSNLKLFGLNFQCCVHWKDIPLSHLCWQQFRRSHTVGMSVQNCVYRAHELLTTKNSPRSFLKHLSQAPCTHEPPLRQNVLHPSRRCLPIANRVNLWRSTMKRTSISLSFYVLCMHFPLLALKFSSAKSKKFSTSAKKNRKQTTNCRACMPISH